MLLHRPPLHHHIMHNSIIQHQDTVLITRLAIVSFPFLDTTFNLYEITHAIKGQILVSIEDRSTPLLLLRGFLLVKYLDIALSCVN